MDTFQIFINILKKHIKQQNYDGIVEILRDGRKYFENIPSTNIGK